jgi:hypothetical protein
MLIGSGLPRPQTQIEVRGDWNGVLARIDMGWQEWKVGVEFDGAHHWTDPAQRTLDIDRLAELQARGWGSSSGSVPICCATGPKSSSRGFVRLCALPDAGSDGSNVELTGENACFDPTIRRSTRRLGP